MSLSAAQMMKQSSDVTYYAQAGTGKAATTTATSPTIATATVTGSGIFTCNYTLSVTATGTNNLYTAFQSMTGKSTGQIVLTVAGQALDFNTASLFTSKTVTGTLTGLTSANSQNLTAQLKVVNSSTVDQSALAGKDITVTIAATAFTCFATA